MTMEPPSPRSLGRYQLLFMLGQGGMGEVHLAKLSGVGGFEKLCIVKTILPQMKGDEQFIDRFHHEARVLVHLNHSNIAQVYDMGEVDGTLYMAIEYVPGVDLARVQSRAARARAAIPVPIALYLGQRIAEALGYAHRKTGPDGAPLGIVHRDVSPQNVMVSYEGEVKVIDFGLAKSAARSKHTLPSTVMGKLGYMSPEQAMAQPLDHRSDIYSAGIVLWELLAGRPLFEGGTMAEMVVKMAQPTVPPLRSINPEVSARVDQVLLRALAADPSARFSRADDFARALNELAVREGQTVSSEEVGNYVRAMCPEEFAAERALQSKLSVMRKRGSAALATPLPAPEIEGTLLRPSSSGAKAELTPAQRALSVSDQGAPGVYAAIPHGAQPGSKSKPAPKSRPASNVVVAPDDEAPSAPVVLPRSRAPWIVVGILGVAAVAVIGAAALKSLDQPKPEPVTPVVATKPDEVEPKRQVAREELPKEEPAKVEAPEAAAAPKPVGTVKVAGPVFSVKQGDDELVVLLKDKKALKKGDQVDFIGEPAADKTAPLFAEGVVLGVTGMVADLGVYDEAPLPPRVFVTRDLHEKAATARTVGKPKKAATTVTSATSVEPTPEPKVEPKVEPKPKVDAKTEPEPKVATAEPFVPAMNPDNPFDKTRAPPPTKVEPARVEPTKVVATTTVQPIQQAAQAGAARKVTGSVQLIGAKGSGVARLLNTSAFSLTTCTLRLPGQLVYKFSKEIYAGSAADVPLVAFSTDPNPPLSEMSQGWVPVYCKEGTGFLKLYDQRQ
jgi:serine/threonine protein kinase